MRGTTSHRSASRPLPYLLFDTEEAAEILNLSSEAVVCLDQIGVLVPSVVIGYRRLFSLRDLERFAHPDERRQIDLNGHDQELLVND